LGADFKELNDVFGVDLLWLELPVGQIQFGVSLLIDVLSRK